MAGPHAVMTAHSPAPTAHPEPVSSHTTLERLLLVCGLLAPLLYIAMNVLVPLTWDGYSTASQTISELSAIDAPTRPLWVPLGVAYTLLIAVFGWGVWKTAGGSRALQVVGALLIVQGLFGYFWPPMHLRGAGFTLTDTLHIVWTMVVLCLMLVSMGFAATVLGKRFRLYTLATVAVWLVFGTLTGMESPRVAANLPTPWIGVWERINAGAYMLWLMMLSLRLLRDRGPRVRAAAVAGGRP